MPEFEDGTTGNGPVTGQDDSGRRWLKIIDQNRCIGCHACTTACKSENEVPLSVTRTYVKSVDVGTFPQARRAFQVTRCNQCEDAPCVAACPTSAMFRRPDGIVDFDKDACIGCKACMAACPYDAIFINPEDHSAEKCNLCAHRLDVGLEPACVVVCPTQAIIVGDGDDPDSEAARVVAREPVAVRRPEKGTRPKLFYRGATQATLDPLAARRPAGDTFMWSEIPTGTQQVTSGHPGGANSSAAALLSYDITHRAPWDWRVSLYTWTKGIAAGAYLVAVLLALTGQISWTDSLLVWTAPLLAAVFLALTAGLLVWDLEHPGRFFYLLTRPQWRSWLVRGGIVLTGYAAVLGLHLLAGLLGSTGLRQAAAAPGVPLAAMTAIYTAYLFAQAKARDLWQNPLLPAHLLVQAVLAGAAALLPAAAGWRQDAVTPLGWILAGACLTHLLLVLGEVTLTHPTAHARLAASELTRGRFRGFFWAAAVLVAAGLAAPWAGAWVAPLALAGLAAHEHAYVQAGQAVPLA
ncbi:4Fe-4S dicluster domain-containing protein [Streptomyces sp. NPDC101225]|uniref:4Fe-4S dicluster domain-containing protein n=1 Tax=Streptomyces sp. NPDC101225 TaxID=3366135 RepID=UPI003813270F